jgi:hypothetical protein
MCAWSHLMSQKLRVPPPNDQSARLLFANRHTCCICRGPRHEVQIHHIDENPANNEWDNLAVLCLNCHGRVTGRPGFGRKFSRQEVLEYKRDWESQCAELNAQGALMQSGADDQDDDDGDDEPVETDHFVRRVSARDDYVEEFDLAADDTLEVSVQSDEFIGAYLCDRSDYRKYENGDELSFWVGRDDVRECRLSLVAPRNGYYCLLITNGGDEDAEVTIEWKVWSEGSRASSS